MSYLRRGGGIVVRPFVADDAEPLYRAVRASIDSLGYWLPWCHAGYSLVDAEDWVAFSLAAWAGKTEFPFGVFDGDTGQLLGTVGLNQVSRINRSANLGYWVGDPWRGRGVAARAASLAATIGFESLDMVRLEVVVLPHNHASQRVAEKIGAVRECEARNRLMFQGRPSNAIVYSLVPSDLAEA